MKWWEMILVILVEGHLSIIPVKFHFRGDVVLEDTTFIFNYIMLKTDDI